MKKTIAMITVMAAAGAGVVYGLEPRGSLDALTVVAGTQPAATAPATLPAGHGHGHEGMQTIKTGALRVLASQGTKGAAALGKDAVKVELFAKGKVIGTYNKVLDEKGVVEVDDLPLDVPFQPVVTVMHDGVGEQLVGPAMHKFQPAVELEMKVYELTSEKPAWTVGIRHVVVETVEENGRAALQVTETLGGFNPTDRAWTGEKGVTVAIGLPAGVQGVALGPGLAEAGATITKEGIVRGGTMMPGSTGYVFGYRVPVKDGAATLTFSTPAATTLFAAYVPGDVVVKSVTGATTGKAEGRQLIKARNLKTTDVVTVELAGVKLPPPPETGPSINDLPNGIHVEAKP